MVVLTRPALLATLAAMDERLYIARRARADLQWDKIVDQARSHCQSELGQKAIGQLPFLVQPDIIRHTLQLVSEFRLLADTVGTPPCSGLIDAVPLIERAARQGVLEAEEVLAVADTLRAAYQLRRFVLRHQARVPAAAQAVEALPDREDLCRWVYERFDSDGTIRDEASPRLAELRRKVQRQHERIRHALEAYLHDPAVDDLLQDTFWTERQQRYVLPIKVQYRNAMPGIVHGSSRSGQTLFVEPEALTRLNNELKLAEQEVENEEYQIRRAASVHVAAAQAEVAPAVRLLTELDTLIARALLAKQMDGRAPSLVEDTRIVLDQLKNPLLLLKGAAVVANRVELTGPGRVLVVSGPNAGGKTVTLNSLGLCQLMVQAGYLIPASSDSCLPVFDSLHTVMGEQQSIERDLSTFSGQIEQLDQILQRCGPRSLVLIDEIVVGTEPGQGAALAQAFLEALADRKATVAVTTHYDRLKALSHIDARFANASVGFDPDSGRPTFRLSTGLAGASSPITIAAGLGVARPILDRARAIFGEPALQLEAVVRQLETERQRLEAVRVVLQTEQQIAQRAAERHREAEQRLARDATRLARQACQKTLDTVEQLKEELAAMAKTTRDLRPGDPEVAGRRKRVREIEHELQTLQPPDPDAPPVPTRPPLAAAELVRGSKVWVESLGKIGEIIDVPGDLRRVAVQVGSLRSLVPFDDLRKPDAADKSVGERAAKPARASRGGAPFDVHQESPPPRTTENTCDLRGVRCEEAVETLEKRLDQAVVSDQECLFVLHGHGSGALKQAVRQYLKGNRYTLSWRAARAEEGGDGFTVVWLHLDD